MHYNSITEKCSLKGMMNMDGNQKIHCNVESCKYNDYNQNKCTLTAIQVTPKQNCKSKKADESMCSSYENEKE